MSPNLDQLRKSTLGSNAAQNLLGSGPDEEAMQDAAEALRQAEVEAALPEAPGVSTLDASQLESMSIDELRAVAEKLEIPDRAQITEQDELIAAIQQRL